MEESNLYCFSLYCRHVAQAYCISKLTQTNTVNECASSAKTRNPTPNSSWSQESSRWKEQSSLPSGTYIRLLSVVPFRQGKVIMYASAISNCARVTQSVACSDALWYILTTWLVASKESNGKRYGTARTYLYCTNCKSGVNATVPLASSTYY